MERQWSRSIECVELTGQLTKQQRQPRPLALVPPLRTGHDDHTYKIALALSLLALGSRVSAWQGTPVIAVSIQYKQRHLSCDLR